MSGAGYAILTDSHHKKDGFYRVLKTANINSTVTQMNVFRAKRDTEIVAFFPCNVVTAEPLIKTALKNKIVAGTTDWIACNEAALQKLQENMQKLIEISKE